MSPKIKPKAMTITRGMHYATMIALIISNLTVLGLGAILSNQLLGNGLGYFAQLDEQGKLEQSIMSSRVFEQGPSLSNLLTVQVPPSVQNAFNLGWFAGKEFVVDWIAHNHDPVKAPLKVLIPPATLVQILATSGSPLFNSKTINDIPDGAAISFAYQWGFAKGITMYSTQTMPPVIRTDLAVINEGLSDATLIHNGFIKSIVSTTDTRAECGGIKWYPDESTLSYCKDGSEIHFDRTAVTSGSCCGISISFATP